MSDRLAKMFTPLVLSSGKKHPYLLYGTGFKKERTGALTTLALQHGFEGIDTANYPSAYEETLTGDGIIKSGVNKNDILVSRHIILLALILNKLSRFKRNSLLNMLTKRANFRTIQINLSKLKSGNPLSSLSSI